MALWPFAPEIVLPTIQNYERMRLNEAQHYGCKATFNPTFPVDSEPEYGWVLLYHFGINQGPIVTMIESQSSVRISVGVDVGVSVRRHRLAAGGVQRWMVGMNLDFARAAL